MFFFKKASMKFTVEIVVVSCIIMTSWGDRFNDSVMDLMSQLFTNIMPSCDIIIGGNFAEGIDWEKVTALEKPIYTVGPRPTSHIYLKEHKMIKPSAYPCSTVLLLCYSFRSCQEIDLDSFHQHLTDNKILKAETRIILYSHEAETQHCQRWKTKDEMPAEIRKASRMLNFWRAHIILILKVSKKAFCISFTAKKLQAENETVYQLHTWSTSWMPGGTSFQFEKWDTVRGFWHSGNNILLTKNNVRKGGTTRFCVSSERLLPSIEVINRTYAIGLEAEIARWYQSKLGSKLIFSVPKNSLSSKKQKKGNLALACVAKRQAEFAIGQISFSAERLASELRYTPAFLVLQGVVVCVKPESLPKWFILFRPFQMKTWVTFIATAVSFLIIVELSQTLVQSTENNSKNVKVPWVQTIGPMFQRSVAIQKISRRTGILLCFSTWLLLCYIMSVTYSVLMMANFSVPPTMPRIDSLRQLVQSKSKWSITPLVMQSLDDSDVAAVIEQQILRGGVAVEDDYLGDKDLAAYLYASSKKGCAIAEKNRARHVILKYFTTNRTNGVTSQMYLSQGTFLIGPTGWAMRSDIDFIIKSYVDDMILTFSSQGFAHHIRGEVSGKLCKNCQKEKKAESMKIESMYIILYILLMGLASATACFLLEIIFFHIIQKN